MAVTEQPVPRAGNKPTGEHPRGNNQRHFTSSKLHISPTAPMGSPGKHRRAALARGRWEAEGHKQPSTGGPQQSALIRRITWRAQAKSLTAWVLQAACPQGGTAHTPAVHRGLCSTLSLPPKKQGVLGCLQMRLLKPWEHGAAPRLVKPPVPSDI